MGLAEQAERRLELARKLGREPRRWIATEAVASELRAEAPEAWYDDGGAFLGLPIERGATRWGLVLLSEPI